MDHLAHDPDTDGNIFTWVLLLAENRRRQLTHQAHGRAHLEAARTVKYHEQPPEPAARPPIVLASTPARIA